MWGLILIIIDFVYMYCVLSFLTTGVCWSWVSFLTTKRCVRGGIYELALIISNLVYLYGVLSFLRTGVRGVG